MCEAPQTLVDTYILATQVLRISGLFPFSHHAKSNEFRLSWPLLICTILQLLIFIYVNCNLLLTDWRNYVQPTANRSLLTEVGNLILRLVAFICTSVILLSTIFANRRLIGVINMQLHLEVKFFELGLNTSRLYGQLRRFSLFSCLAFILWISLNCWHSIHFYKLITKQNANLYYYLLVILSDYYRLIFVFYMRIQLIALYYMSKQLNGLMQELVNMEHRRYARGYSKGIAWVYNIK